MKKLGIIKIRLIIAFIVFLFLLGITYKSSAMLNYQTVGTPTGLVTATTLNVRQGPGSNFKITTTVSKNQYIRIFAKIGDWYVIQTDSNYIGAVSSSYVKLIYPNSTGNNTPSTPPSTPNTGTDLTADEKEVFDLINAKRTAAGLSPLKIDGEVQNIARIKAKDMVNNNYFSHTSPTYGSPFDMMKSFKISYRTAGENIAGNSSNKGAVDAWMNSEGHRANILNSTFTHTGIGVVKSNKYGKVYVQMFISK